MTTPRRRWFQFSLRTLIVLVTLLCVWFGMETNRVRNQRRAVAMIEKLGGQVFYRHQYPKGVMSNVDVAAEVPAPHWLRNIVGDDYFRHVNTAYLFGDAPHTDEEWALVSSLTSLEILQILQPIQDDTIRHFHRLSNLKVLIIFGSELTDEGMRSIARLDQLKVLSINLGRPDPRSQITDAGLESIRHSRNLELLHLEGVRITDAGLVHFKDFKKLTDLRLVGTDVSDAGIRHLMLLPLVSVQIENTRVTAQGIRQLATIQTIRDITAKTIDPETQALLAARRTGNAVQPAGTGPAPKSP